MRTANPPTPTAAHEVTAKDLWRFIKKSMIAAGVHSRTAELSLERVRVMGASQTLRLFEQARSEVRISALSVHPGMTRR